MYIRAFQYLTPVPPSTSDTVYITYGLFHSVPSSAGTLQRQYLSVGRSAVHACQMPVMRKRFHADRRKLLGKMYQKLKIIITPLI